MTKDKSTNGQKGKMIKNETKRRKKERIKRKNKKKGNKEKQ